jgi:hypothetical protein
MDKNKEKEMDMKSAPCGAIVPVLSRTSRPMNKHIFHNSVTWFICNLQRERKTDYLHEQFNMCEVIKVKGSSP